MDLRRALRLSLSPSTSSLRSSPPRPRPSAGFSTSTATPVGATRKSPTTSPIRAFPRRVCPSGCARKRRARNTKREAKNAWAIATVQGILDNDFYIGTLRQGKYTRAKINGRDMKRDDDEHIVIENHHQAIIDYRTFATTRALREKRSRMQLSRREDQRQRVLRLSVSAATAAARMFAMSRQRSCSPPTPAARITGAVSRAAPATISALTSWTSC